MLKELSFSQMSKIFSPYWGEKSERLGEEHYSDEDEMTDCSEDENPKSNQMNEASKLKEDVEEIIPEESNYDNQNNSEEECEIKAKEGGVSQDIQSEKREAITVKESQPLQDTVPSINKSPLLINADTSHLNRLLLEQEPKAKKYISLLIY